MGRLPPFPVATPWWQDAQRWSMVPGAVRDPATVLRLLSAELPRPPRWGRDLSRGGRRGDRRAASPAGALAGTLDDHPLRSRGRGWAVRTRPRLGGPTLTAAGRQRTGDAVQMRTWNLSSVWRLPTTAGSVWLKVVPPFFAHEGASSARWPAARPRCCSARDGPRILMADIPGDDRSTRPARSSSGWSTGWSRIQRAWAGRVDELSALGLPDWRAPFLSAAIADVVARTADQLTADARATLDGFVDGLRTALPRSTSAACRTRSSMATSRPAMFAAMGTARR